MTNSTSYSNITTRPPWNPGVDLQALSDAQTGIYSTFSIIGVPLNLWFLAVILSCPKLRASLRNRLISGLLFAHLLDTAIILPFFLAVERDYRYRPETTHTCVVRSIYWNLYIIQDAIANWTIVLLLAWVLTKISECDIACYLPRARMILSLLPWVISIITIPVLTAIFTAEDALCVTAERYYMVVFNSVNCSVPLIVAIFLLVLMAVQKWRRLSSSSSRGPVRTELIGSNTEVSFLPYVVMVAVAVVFDIPNMCRYLEFPFESFASRVYFAFASHIMTSVRSVVMPLVFLLLPDILDRLKIWRPWRWSNTTDQYTVGYSNQDV